MVFNNRDEVTKFRVRDCDGFSAEDLESGEKLPVADGVLEVEVPVLNFRLVELKK